MTSPSVMTINNGFRNSMNCEAKKIQTFFAKLIKHSVKNHFKSLILPIFKKFKIGLEQIEKLENDPK